MSDWWNQPTRPVEPLASTDEPPSECPWCAQPASPNAYYCSSCGAVMAQHEDLGGLAIPGVTVVDPAMQARTYRSSVIGSQARISTLNTIGNGPGGTMVQVAAAAAILAGDSVRGLGGSANVEEIGKPSQSALEMSERLRHVKPETAPREAVENSTPKAGEPAAQSEETGGSR